MDFKHLFSILLQVVSDFRVILIFICVILYLNFVIYISRYRKTPRRSGSGRRRSRVVAVQDDEEVTLPDAPGDE